MQARKHIRLFWALLIALFTLGLGHEAGRSVNSNLETPTEAPTQATALGPGPIPPAGPLAAPKTLKQMGVPVEATRAIAPADNPQTPAKIALGEKLFFDGRLSVDGTVACSTCHDPAKAFTDGRPVSIGVHGRAGQRNAPTILNALYNKTQFWDGRVKTLEEQAALPIINPSEMGQPNMDAAVAKIAALPEYQQAFRGVFGNPPNTADLLRAKMLRRAIWRVAEAVLATASPLIDDVRRINRMARQPGLVRQLDEEAKSMDWQRPTTAAALATIAQDAVLLFGDPAQRARLRRCENSGCRTIFFDDSRPGRRRWCAPNRCGDRIRARLYRERRRS